MFGRKRSVSIPGEGTISRIIGLSGAKLNDAASVRAFDATSVGTVILIVEVGSCHASPRASEKEILVGI